uniref:Uncharacterized protein n=1 Tax=Anopheles maculatus TaxID=74869 RepID=A0A182SRR1_9DIPT
MKPSVLQTLLEPATALAGFGKKQTRQQHPTCTNNRRDGGRGVGGLLPQDKCGRAPVYALGLLFCVTLYLYFTTTAWTDTTQMIVTIPGDDADLPGPKDQIATKCTTNHQHHDASLASADELQLTSNRIIPLVPQTNASTTITTVPGAIDNFIVTNAAAIDRSTVAGASSPVLTNITTEPTDPYAPVPKGFIVWGPGCQIMDLNPVAKDVMRLFSKERFVPCSPKQPLTTIEQNFDNDTVLVRFHRDRMDAFMPHYMRYVRCCYQSIERSGTKDKADKNFWVGECVAFNESFLLPPSVRNGILIRCKAGVSESSKSKKAIYTNVHALVRPQPNVRERIDKFNGRAEKRPLSVLMIGIDSISRLNLIRAMPHTAQHLYDTGWFELKGYNK